MTFYRRRLPHLYEIDVPTFLTWRLHGSLPPNRCFPPAALSSGKAFVAMDRLLDGARIGPLYLRQPALAELVVEALHQNASALNQYDLHAYVVMPNHVHVMLTPHIPLPRLTKSIKGITAKRVNEILRLAGTPFWQEESYDHLVRDRREAERIRMYIEHNPVQAGLVNNPEDYRWSSAWMVTRGSPADQGVRPTP